VLVRIKSVLIKSYGLIRIGCILIAVVMILQSVWKFVVLYLLLTSHLQTLFFYKVIFFPLEILGHDQIKVLLFNFVIPVIL